LDALLGQASKPSGCRLYATNRASQPKQQAFVNGPALKDRDIQGHFIIPNGTLTSEFLNIIIIRLTKVEDFVPILQAHDKSMRLEGKWQFRSGDDPNWTQYPIPPQFGAATDHIHSGHYRSS
jgi:hypothetical protein